MEPHEGEVEIEFDGETFKGTYKVARGMITVTYWDQNVPHETTAEIGGSTDAPVGLARIMLDELVIEALARRSR